jgi:F0F1-type ATP synthase delta subunit
MKYKVKDYAKALAEILSAKNSPTSGVGVKVDEKKLSAGFIKLLEKQGDLGKAKEILEKAEMFLAKKAGKKSITFETARKLSDHQKKAFSKFIEKGDVIKEKINPDLIAGIKVVVDGDRQIDYSMKNKINKIFS